jgi:hypothetical protein
MISSKAPAPLAASRLLLTLLCVLLLVSIANAYTIVLRDGRRIEIPADFVTTSTTLTYEVSAGIQVTRQLATVDIAATERANSEPDGGFFRHSAKQSTPLEAKGDNERVGQNTGKQRTVTNRDLETFRRARVESELAYERRRQELGLPSIEESRRRAAIEADATFQQVRELRSQEQEAEASWRSKASALRAEIASTNARINFLRVRINEISQISSGPFIDGLPLTPFGQTTVGAGLWPTGIANPGVFVGPSVGSQIGARVGFGNGIGRGRVFVNPGPFRGPRHFGLGSYPFPGTTILSVPFQSYDYSFERPALITELDQSLSYRAGLEARWRDLEEEARRAGVPPGWLRP